MYFQSPRPFGQQSTSFRPVGSSGHGMRSASSLSVLTTATFDTTGPEIRQNEIAPSAFSTYTYDSPGEFVVDETQRKYFTVTTEDGDISRFNYNQKTSSSMKDDLAGAGGISNRFPQINTPMVQQRSQYFLSSLGSNIRVPRKTTSLTDALPGDKLCPGFSGWSTNSSLNQVESRNASNSSATISHVSRDAEFTSNFTSPISTRCMSEVPYADYVPCKVSQANNSNSKEVLFERKARTLPRVSGYSHEPSVIEESSTKSTETSRQRHTSDGSMKFLRPRLPNEVSADIMLNAALGVKAELEQDPKFRSRAENLRQNRFPARNSQPPNHYKQSPSFLQLQGYLLNSKTTLQPPLVSSTFSPEKVHSLFGKGGEVFATNAVSNDLQPDFFTSEIRTINVEPQHGSSSDINSRGQEKVKIIPIVIQTEKRSDTEANANAYKPAGLIQSQTHQPSADETASVNGQKDLANSALVGRSVFSGKSQTKNSVALPHQLSAISPPSILVRSSSISSADGGAKPAKKVVFQCDPELVRRLAGKEDLYSKDMAGQEAPPSITQYDEAVEGPLNEFVKLSQQIEGDVKDAGAVISRAFAEMRKFIWNASGQAELAAGEKSAKLAPVSQSIEKMGALAASKRNTPFFNHLSALSDGIPALGWLTVKPTPGPFVKEMRDAAMFYVNRVFKDYRDGDKVHIQWAKSWVELLTALEKYVRQVHTTGLVWNSSPGAVCSDASATGEAASGPPSGPAPLPPPVIPANLLDAAPKESGAADRSALFAELNKGEGITKGLKKVTKDMQTHKNPNLRAQGPLKKDTAGKTGAGAASAKKTEIEKPPKFCLENGKQWNVEYHKSRQDLVVEITDLKQTVYIYKCENCVVQIKGKCNSISLDSCKKTSVVFDSLLSQMEVINCQSAQVQALGPMPTISIQKTDGCQVYLSKESLNAEMVSSKSSQMNILVPGAEEGDFNEFPIPEQYKTIFDGKKLQTTVSDIV